jgi:hypothetical protein
MSEDSQELSPGMAATVAGLALKTAEPATYESLIKKPRRTLSFDVTTGNDAGEEIKLAMKFQAINSTRYDELQAEHPPTTKERREGAIYNVDTFAPALIAEVSLIPKLTVEQASELYHSPDWAPGEVGNLFLNAMGVCNQGLSVPFNARD